ncbi:PmoA family protein [Amycolatopsis suaedae]|uniref:DUF6807 domain-containing protein n=1 Tax=Amycolatopsis suaedae TaxID=2510978 RepID=UPI0013EF55B6|nr:PmoA family protein [Amycolatopsis suaedae]
MTTLRLCFGGDDVAVLAGEVTLLRYVHRPRLTADLAPRPYAHEVRTLSGTVVTGFRPGDHPWHAGLGVAVPHVSGVNFWGGPTYVHGRGYRDLGDHGRIRHDRWSDARVTSGAVELAEELTWLDGQGRALLRERRTLRVGDVGSGSWVLGFGFHLRSLSARPLRFDSPATRGRAGAGYGGLFWRASDAFRGGRVRTGTAAGEEAVNGTRAPEVVFESAQGPPCTVTFTADGDPWFVRSAEYPGVCAALASDVPLTLPPGGELSRRHHLTVTGEA